MAKNQIVFFTAIMLVIGFACRLSDPSLNDFNNQNDFNFVNSFGFHAMGKRSAYLSLI